MNGGIILITILLKDKLGIVGLAWATFFGMGLQLVVLGWRFARNHYSLHLVGWASPALKQTLLLATPMIVASLFSQVYIFVDKGLASGLDAGSIAALNYAMKLVQLPVGIFVTALATAIYPTLADFAGKADKHGFNQAVSSGHSADSDRAGLLRLGLTGGG